MTHLKIGNWLKTLLYLKLYFFEFFNYDSKRKKWKFPKFLRITWNCHPSLRRIKCIYMWCWNEFWQFLNDLRSFEISEFVYFCSCLNYIFQTRDPRKTVTYYSSEIAILFIFVYDILFISSLCILSLTYFLVVYVLQSFTFICHAKYLL